MKNVKLEIDETEINISIRKSKLAKYVRLQLHPKRGFEVVLPYRAANNLAHDIIIKNKLWIKEVHNKSNKQQKRFFYLGELVTVQNYPQFFINNKQDYIFDEIKELNEKLYDNFLRSNGKKYLTDRINILANKMQLRFKELRIRALTHRWGSCSSKKIITLNYRLMQLPPLLIDYIIVHELCHLIEMNHSERFWKLVAKEFPNYKELRKEISKYS